MNDNMMNSLHGKFPATVVIALLCVLFRGKLQAALEKLPPLKIGRNGTIQEWIEDYQEQDPRHRRVSHLLGLHPFSLISAETPDLLDAARKTLERSGAGGDVGWSNAWKINFYARLGDGEQAHAYDLKSALALE